MRKLDLNINEYEQKDNTLIRDVKDSVADHIKVEIGDAKQAEFFPQLKIQRWDNETNLSVRRDNGAREFVTRDGKIVAENKKEDVVIYELAPDESNGDGGIEIELHLKEKPDTNRFDFTIQTKGLNFFYQAPLTDEEKEQGASRPDNVIGSYAVYHANKRDNRVGGKEYKTGKFCHIYRPHITDADGNETWGELELDEQAGILTVVVPEAFLDKASYPVVVDPTFGYTSIGATSAGVGSAFSSAPVGGKFSLSENGTITEVSYAVRYSTNNDTTGEVAVYSDDTGTPDSRIDRKTNFSFSGTTFAFVNTGMVSSLLSPGDFWFWITGTTGGTGLSGSRDVAYDTTGGVGGQAVDDQGFGNTTFNLIGFSTNSRNYSIYATYTASGTNITANSCEDDDGFANVDTPADETPFNSGDRISYTVQSPLDVGTYYWRVRGKDPSGSDTFGDWSETREFEISSASEETETHTIDALVREEVTVTHTVDTLVRDTETATHTADTLVRAEATVSHTLDTLAREEQTATHTVDTLARAEATVTHSIDTNVYELGEETVTHTVDTLVLQEVEASHSIDTLVSEPEEDGCPRLLEDGETRLLENGSSRLLEGCPVGQETVTHSIDTLVREEQTNTHTVDVLVRDELTNSHTVDTLVRNEETVSHTVDTLARAEQVNTHTVDTLVRATETETHTVDTLVRDTETATHTTDTLVRAEQTATHTADTLVRDTQTNTHSIDTLVRAPETNTHTIDTLVLAEQTVSHSIDTVVWIPGEELYQHTVDVLVRDDVTTTHTADTLVHNEETATHSVDTLVLAEQTSTHTIDVLVRDDTGTGNIKYWNGTDWEVKQLKYWDGATWVDAPLKRWNGVDWELITY